jgi:hypothetical protein
MAHTSSLLHPKPDSSRPYRACTISSEPLGWLIATPESFLDLTLPIVGSATSWGRNTNNTIVYTDKDDTRIPKTAFVLHLYLDAPAEGKSASLKAAICTYATYGISVNDKHLKRLDENGDRIYGDLRTGDIISIYHSPLKEEVLKFQCVFDRKVVGRERDFEPIVYRPTTINKRPR